MGSLHCFHLESCLFWYFPLIFTPPSVTPSQRSLHNAPIFRLLLKVAVKGTHQCDFLNFWGALAPTLHSQQLFQIYDYLHLDLTVLQTVGSCSQAKQILLWMTPSEAPKALQTSECSELLDPMRASCWIFAQHQPVQFMDKGVLFIWKQSLV